MKRAHCDRCQPGAFRASGQETWCDACLRGVLAGENPHSYVASLTLDWYAVESSQIDTPRVRRFGYDAKKSPATLEASGAVASTGKDGSDMADRSALSDRMAADLNRGAA